MNIYNTKIFIFFNKVFVVYFNKYMLRKFSMKSRVLYDSLLLVEIICNPPSFGKNSLYVMYIVRGGIQTESDQEGGLGENAGETRECTKLDLPK